MSWINRFLHYIEHLFKWNTGKIVTFEEDDMLCVGFQCTKCGVIDPTSIEKIPRNLVINESENYE